MKQRIQFCTSRDGARIAYATAGEGPPLVRVNNWFTHLELDWDNPVWCHWSEALAERRMLVRYDPRGSGLSDRDVTDFSLNALVSDLEAVVDAQKLLARVEGIWTAPEAAAALAAINADYPRHCRAARALVERHFDARRVAATILEHATG